jgi:transglutaminase-like putative cysteine protease
VVTSPPSAGVANGRRTTPGSLPAGPNAPVGGQRRRARRPVVIRWPLSLTLLVLLITSTAALGPVLAGSAWWWVLLVVAAVVFTAAAIIRRARVPGVLVPFLSAGILVLVLTLLFGGGTGLFWLLPTGETLTRFADQAEAGVLSIQTQDAPAGVADGILFLLAVGVGLLAILMDTLAVGLRFPALAGVPVLVPLLVPGFVVAEGADWSALVATAIAYLVLLLVEVHLRPAPAPERGVPIGAAVSQGGGLMLRGAVAIAALGIVAALVVSAAVPRYGGTGSGPRSTNALFGSGVTPLIDLGEDLRRPQPGPALHYRTTATEQPYLALFTLDDIRGTTWLPRAVAINLDNTVDTIDAPPGLSDGVARTSATTTISIDGVRTNRLPVPVPATSVDGLAGDWFWNNDTRTISSPETTTTGQRYSVTSLEIQPTREQLRESESRYPAGVELSQGLPDNAPGIIGDTARAVTASAPSNYDAAVALQDYLRGNDFTYDTEAPVEDDYDGGGADVIGTFLEVKRGYCVHFASAMALMARSLDIPARITVGYLPGTRTTTVVGGLNRYNVDSHDLHAWPELYFAGVGWVPFEPTPGRGTVPEYATPVSSTVTGQPAPAAAPSIAPPQAAADGLGPGAQETGAPAEEDPTGIVGRVVLVTIGVLLLLLVPAVWRWVRRRRRRAALATGRANASAAWQELADTITDHGGSAPDTLTARELASNIGTRRGVADTPEAVRALDRLLEATERTRYARSTGSNPAADPRLLGDLDLVVGAVQSGSPALQRCWAVLAPASLSAPILRRMGLLRDPSEVADRPGHERTPAGA